MTPSIGWVPGIPPGDKTPYVPTNRFTGTGKLWRIWLLGDARCVAVHYKPGEHTEPCLAHEGKCGFCLDRSWWVRNEAYAPAMLEIKKLPDPHWQPILAIFTAGGYKQLGVTPHRGKMFDVDRIDRKKCEVLRLNLIQCSDPLRPAFDIEPLMKRLWWPKLFELDPIPIELPDAIPIPVEEVSRAPFQPTLQPVLLSEEEQQRMIDELESRGMKKMAQLKRDQLAARQAEAKSAVTVAVPPQPRTAVVVAEGVETVTALTGKKPGGLLAAEVIADPANYTPKTLVVGGDTDEGVLSEPARAALRANREEANRLKKLDAEQRELEELRSREGQSVTNRLTTATDAIDAVTSRLAGTSNGKHPAKKGGAA